MYSVLKMEEFLERIKHPAETINSKFDKEEQTKFEKNCTVIESLLKMVLMCGKQLELAFRGHRDDGIDFMEEKGVTCLKMMKTLSNLFVSELKQMLL